jgi:hypothetical protein
MAAVTRWTEYSVDATTYVASSFTRGERGYKDSTLLTNEDTFTLTSSNNKLYLNMDGAGSFTLTLASGTGLDPRLVAKDITEKTHAYDTADRYQMAQCDWGCLAGSNINGFRMYSGTIGSSSSMSVASGVDTAHLTLGFSVGAGTGGVNTSFGGATYSFNGDVLTSGTWYGFWDETYQIMIGEDEAGDAKAHGITSTVVGGSNTYVGTMTTAGIYADNVHTPDTYIINIDTTNGTTVGAGAGNGPRYKITGHASDNNPSDWVDILYADYWYPVGTQGVKVKWTDAVFNTVSTGWTVAVESPQYAAGTNTTAPQGIAKYVWASNRGDDSLNNPVTTVSGGYTALGDRGLYITFSGSTDLGAREVYHVMCRAPQPSTYAITQLNYGNVTVSTESPVKTVAFEIMSGAYEISSVKFGLQSDGSFSHHDQGDDDTYFRFGTVGPENNATVGAATSSEWYPGIAATDIDSDTPPAYLYATEDDLAVVASADLSEDLGSQQTYLQADPLWLCIRLGANETGANSTINYRLYFDYS